MHGRLLHRQPVCPSGHHRLDPWLEEERLAHRGQEAGQERRSVAAARRRPEDASGALALGQGPCRSRRERARRSAGAGGHRDGAIEAEGGGLKARKLLTPSPKGKGGMSSPGTTVVI